MTGRQLEDEMDERSINRQKVHAAHTEVCVGVWDASEGG